VLKIPQKLVSMSRHGETFQVHDTADVIVDWPIQRRPHGIAHKQPHGLDEVL
jgi:hypothetical protein